MHGCKQFSSMPEINQALNKILVLGGYRTFYWESIRMIFVLIFLCMVSFLKSPSVVQDYHEF